MRALAVFVLAFPLWTFVVDLGVPAGLPTSADITVSATVTSQSLTTTCRQPCFVFGDATATTHTGTGTAGMVLKYEWRWGDAGAGTWSTGVGPSSKDRSYFPLAAHLYESTGSFDIEVWVWNEAGEVEAIEVATITVVDPWDATDGLSNVYCVSQDAGAATPGTTPGCPAGATALDNEGDLDVLLRTDINIHSLATTDHLVLFERGDTFTASQSTDLEGSFQFGSYGTGADPILTKSHATQMFQLTTDGDTKVRNSTITDIEFQSTNSTVAANNTFFICRTTNDDSEDFGTRGLTFNNITRANQARNFFQCGMVGGTVMPDLIGVFNSTLSGGQRGLGLVTGSRVAVMGVDFPGVSGQSSSTWRPSYYSKALFLHNDVAGEKGNSIIKTAGQSSGVNTSVIDDPNVNDWFIMAFNYLDMRDVPDTPDRPYAIGGTVTSGGASADLRYGFFDSNLVLIDDNLGVSEGCFDEFSHSNNVVIDNSPNADNSALFTFSATSCIPSHMAELGDLRVYNNSLYTAQTDDNRTFFTFQSHTNRVRFRNNILWAQNDSTPNYLVSGLGSGSGNDSSRNYEDDDDQFEWMTGTVDTLEEMRLIFEYATYTPAFDHFANPEDGEALYRDLEAIDRTAGVPDPGALLAPSAPYDLSPYEDRMQQVFGANRPDWPDSPSGTLTETTATTCGQLEAAQVLNSQKILINTALTGCTLDVTGTDVWIAMSDTGSITGTCSGGTCVSGSSNRTKITGGAITLSGVTRFRGPNFLMKNVVFETEDAALDLSATSRWALVNNDVLADQYALYAAGGAKTDIHVIGNHFQGADPATADPETNTRTRGVTRAIFAANLFKPRNPSYQSRFWGDQQDILVVDNDWVKLDNSSHHIRFGSDSGGTGPLGEPQPSGQCGEIDNFWFVDNRLHNNGNAAGNGGLNANIDNPDCWPDNSIPSSCVLVVLGNTTYEDPIDSPFGFPTVFASVPTPCDYEDENGDPVTTEEDFASTNVAALYTGEPACDAPRCGADH